MTPTTQTQTTEKTIEKNKSIFDLDTRAEISVRKIGKFQPVADMQEFVARLGNDSGKILEIVNSGLEDYATKQLATDNSPWYEISEDGELKLDEAKQPVVFSGTAIAEDRWKSFAASVLNVAKSIFGYPDGKLPKTATAEERAANKKLRDESKAAALDMLLSNPVAVEALKK